MKSRARTGWLVQVSSPERPSHSSNWQMGWAWLPHPLTRSAGFWFPEKSAYPQLQNQPSTSNKPGMTADEQEKVKKELIDARDRQTPHVKAGASAARAKPKKP